MTRTFWRRALYVRAGWLLVPAYLERSLLERGIGLVESQLIGPTKIRNQNLSRQELILISLIVETKDEHGL